LENSTAVINIKPNDDPGVIALCTEVNRLQVYADNLTITTDEDVKLATNDLSIIAKLKKALEEKRKEYVSPINEYLKQVNDTFKTITKPLELADLTTRNKVMAYRTEQQRKAAEIERINNLRIEAAQAEAKLNGTGEISQTIEIIEAPAAPPAHVNTDNGTLGTMKIWKFEVVDKALVPEDYKQVDMVKVGSVVRATKGTIAIPGIRIFSEDTLKVSAK